MCTECSRLSFDMLSCVCAAYDVIAAVSSRTDTSRPFHSSRNAPVFSLRSSVRRTRAPQSSIWSLRRCFMERLSTSLLIAAVPRRLYASSCVAFLRPTSRSTRSLHRFLTARSCSRIARSSASHFASTSRSRSPAVSLAASTRCCDFRRSLSTSSPRAASCARVLASNSATRPHPASDASRSCWSSACTSLVCARSASRRSCTSAARARPSRSVSSLIFFSSWSRACIARTLSAARARRWSADFSISVLRSCARAAAAWASRSACSARIRDPAAWCCSRVSAACARSRL
mmetsp:Transcript_71485/g.201789  ORF Transcript_71485/g.201789 Transcript_71485/m.201789 type:complete len:289 (-) Transcript_71485:248-1114(-)